VAGYEVSGSELEVKVANKMSAKKDVEVARTWQQIGRKKTLRTGKKDQ
jgi:hypothetical protein